MIVDATGRDSHKRVMGLLGDLCDRLVWRGLKCLILGGGEISICSHFHCLTLKMLFIEPFKSPNPFPYKTGSQITHRTQVGTWVFVPFCHGNNIHTVVSYPSHLVSLPASPITRHLNWRRT